ncbi:MAG: formyltransferase family protein [Undibacterium sp.]
MKEKAKPRVLVFASGDATGGGSGFQELVEFSRTIPAILSADIVGVVSNHAGGGVAQKAGRLGIDFGHWTGPFTAEGYQRWVQTFEADYVMLSGWLKPVRGLNPARTVNIHPGPLPRFGGKGMYGHHVHEAVMAAYRQGEVTQSAVTMHFVTEEYDQGPIIFEFPVLIRPDDTPDSLAKRVNEKERAWQAYVLSMVVNGDIWLEEDGVGVYSSLPQWGSVMPYLKV